MSASCPTGRAVPAAGRGDGAQGSPPAATSSFSRPPGALPAPAPAPAPPMDVSGRRGAPVPLLGSARLPAGAGCFFVCFLFSWTDRNQMGEVGRGGGQGREQLHGYRMSRTALRGPPPGPTRSRAGRRRCLRARRRARGRSAHRHLRRKELHQVPRGQSQSFPIRAPFLTAHCSPASHCGQRRGRQREHPGGRPVPPPPTGALTIGTCPNFFS